MKLKPKYIGDTINLLEFADQAVAYIKSKKFWCLYASGKASIGRGVVLRAVKNVLMKHGMSYLESTKFITDVIIRVRTEQRAEEKW